MVSARRIIASSLQLTEIEPAQMIALERPILRYLRLVLRQDVGDLIELCDGKGTQWLASIERFTDDHVFCRLIEKLPTQTVAFPVLIAQALVKGERFDAVLRQCTELGATGFIPVSSRHCVVKLDPSRAKKRLVRWQKILEDAARQSERAHVPSLAEPCTLKELPTLLPPDWKAVVCWAREPEQTLRTWLHAQAERPAGVLVLIGPEGGFAAEEIDWLQSQGVDSISLGNTVLRTQTAGPSILSVLHFYWGG